MAEEGGRMEEVIVRYSDNGYGNVSGEMVGELVRCKECRWFNHFEDKEHGEWNTCEKHMIFMNFDDFCNYGEREGD